MISVNNKAFKEVFETVINYGGLSVLLKTNFFCRAYLVLIMYDKTHQR
jgi:hypothetical protein